MTPDLTNITQPIRITAMMVTTLDWNESMMANDIDANIFRLQEAIIENVGPFSSPLKIEFPSEEAKEKAEIHLLVGENGTGKSSMLGALGSLWLQHLQFNPLLAKHIRSDKKWQKDERKVLSANICSFRLETEKSEVFLERIQQADNPDLLVYSQQSYQKYSAETNNQFQYLVNLYSHVTYQPNNPIPLQFPVFGYSSVRNLGISKLPAITVNEESPFIGALFGGAFSGVQRQTAAEWVAKLFVDKAMAGIIFVDSILSSCIGEECHLELETKPNYMLMLKFRNERVPWSGLPDGLVSLMSWVIDLVRRLSLLTKPGESILPWNRSFLLLLDEVDAHLHPEWQRRILPAVQKSFPNAQIIAATHSPFVVGSIDDAWVHRFTLTDEKQVGLASPVHSRKGFGLLSITEELFGISETFDIETTKLLNELRTKRTAAVAELSPVSIQSARDAAETLFALDSSELSSLVSYEMRLLDKEIEAAKPKQKVQPK